MTIDKYQLSNFYRTKLSFMRIGGGALPATRDLFKSKKIPLERAVPVDATPCSSYENGRQRGEYFLLYINLAPVHRHCKVSTADLNGLFAPEYHYLVAEDFLLRLRFYRPSLDQLKNTRIHLGARPSHYTASLSKIMTAGMIAFYSDDEHAVENYFFGV